MTKVLIDSSAWIHFFNQSSLPHYEVVSKVLKEDQACTCGLVITEVLRGARNPKERKILTEHFSLLEYFDLTLPDYFRAAQTSSFLRRKGFTAKTVDLLISHLAIKNRLILLHDDSDFEGIARHTSLKQVNPLSL